ncbi:alpha/beta hydrolase [Calothrix sp. CCY 0018]|uniref:alpha/beta hydrolase n=1 Tax=Calothrix sp. CCY 0018 TaxID=3103864 RepID=UPI0039C74AC3
MKNSYSFLQTIFVLIASIFLLETNSVNAAEKVVFNYKIFSQSLPVEELTQLTETGEVSPTLKYYLNKTNQDPQAVRDVLNKEVNISTTTLDRTLNSKIGEFLLDQISQTIHTSSGRANNKALRSAIVLSSSEDNQVSLMEIIQNYPTNEVYVEADNLERTYNQLSILTEGLQGWLGIL